MTRATSTYDVALGLLEHRPRSVAELRRKLLEKGRERSEVDEVIARLIDQQVLDDGAFARQFARTRLTGPGGGASRFRVLQELARKGVARSVAEQAVDELAADEGVDLSAVVHRAAAKKWKSLASLDAPTRRRRLYGYLARRGFNPDEIRAALDALGEDIPV